MLKRACVVVGLTLAAAFVACGPAAKEICNNGKDDDGNGQIDCADKACATDSSCGAGGGAGKACSTQGECVSSWITDRPLEICSNERCTSQGVSVAVKIQTNTNGFTGTTYVFKSQATRFISTTAVDGGTVDCNAVKAVATSKLAADADQIEKNGGFNEIGYDVIRVGDVPPPNPIVDALFFTATGENFIIWNELWSDYPNSNTHLPQGQRLGYGCFDTGAAVAPITLANDCQNPDAGTCRTITVAMPGPASN